MKLSGFVAWLVWLFVHIMYLIGFRNRILVLIQWAWAYVSYQRGVRLIVEDGTAPVAKPSITSGVSAPKDGVSLALPKPSPKPLAKTH
jgi:hypothetical protein